MYEIIDNNGTIHSGGEDEMRLAFETMILPMSASEENIEKYCTAWTGDLKFIQIIGISR